MKLIAFVLSLQVAFSSTCLAFDIDIASDGAKITLPASAVVTVPNNLATITVYAERQDESLAKVQSEVNQTMAEAQKAIKDFSAIAEVQNAGYSVYPVYTDKTQSGWRARQMIRVVTEDIEGVPALVQLAQSKQLALSGVSYGLSPESRRTFESELLAEAIKALETKAMAVAGAMDPAVGNMALTSIDFGAGFVQPRALMSNALAARATDAVALPVFEAGTTELRLNITAVLTVKAPQ